MAGDEEFCAYVKAYIKAKTEVTIPDLQRELSSDYLTVARAVQKLSSEGVLQFDSGIKFRVVSQSEKEGELQFDSGKKFCVFSQSEKKEGPSDNDEEDDDDDDDESYLRAREQEFIKRMGFDRLKGFHNEEDEEDDEDYDEDEENDEDYEEEIDDDDYDDEDDDEDDDDDEDLDDASPEMRAVIEKLEEGASVFKSDGDYFICLEGLEMGSKAMRFKIQSRDGEIYLSDGGIALLTLKERGFFETDNERIDAIADRYHLFVVGNDLQIKIDSPKTALAGVMRLYAAIERIISIDEETFAACAEHDKQDDKSSSSSSEAAVSETSPIDTVALSDDVEKMKDIITETLAGFHIDSEIVNIAVGAAFIRFELYVPCHVSNAAVTKIDAELAMRLGKKDGVRIYADTISGRICIEVPRIISEREKVQAEKLILGANKGWDKTNALCFAIGKNVDGECIYGDLTRLIHILVGGSSGSGKSMFLHAMIDSFIMRYSPDEVRLILCDAKKTEFANYEGMPYLLTGQIVTEAKEMIRALRWAHKEMERRYCLFEAKTSEGGIVRNIDEYNAARKAGEAKLPRIVIIVDEYADFVTVAKRDIEEAVQFLAQKSRAAGIHLVFATRRPSEKVVTGTLKSNFPTRIAFRMTKEAHSRTILDESGAEKLLGFGDMLIRRASDFRCERIQGAYVSQEVLIADIAANKKMYEAKFDENAGKYIERPNKKTISDTQNKNLDVFPNDPLYVKALAIVIQEGEASISLIQRRCYVGYNHAKKAIEWMESMGYIAPSDGKTKARTVFLTKGQFIKKYGPLE